MPLAFRIMALLGILLGALGLPALLTPATVRATFSLRDTPQMAYVLRIVGAMLASGGLILLVFAFSYWGASG